MSKTLSNDMAPVTEHISDFVEQICEKHVDSSPFNGFFASIQRYLKSHDIELGSEFMEKMSSDDVTLTIEDDNSIIFYPGDAFIEKLSAAVVRHNRRVVPLTVSDIIAEHLNNYGFDGLYFDRECSCLVEDLFPCGGEDIPYCIPGYKTPCDCGEDCDYHIGK